MYSFSFALFRFHQTGPRYTIIYYVILTFGSIGVSVSFDKTPHSSGELHVPPNTLVPCSLCSFLRLPPVFLITGSESLFRTTPCQKLSSPQVRGRVEREVPLTSGVHRKTRLTSPGPLLCKLS